MLRPVNGRRISTRGDHEKKACSAVPRGMRDDRTSVVHLVVVLILSLLPPLAAGAEDGRSYLDMSAGYKTGDFGTPTRSDLYYVMPTLGYVAPRYDVSVAVPYLSMSNKTNGATTSESGIGDVILRGGRVFVPEGRDGFSLDGALAVKLPTADKNKGLGTGETDYGVFLSLHQRFDKTKLSLLSVYQGRRSSLGEL